MNAHAVCTTNTMHRKKERRAVAAMVKNVKIQIKIGHREERRGEGERREERRAERQKVGQARATGLVQQSIPYPGPRTPPKAFRW